MNLDDIIEALEDLCTAHTSLGATKFMRTVEEMHEKMRGTAGACMIMIPVSGDLRGENESAIWKYYTVGFCINKPFNLGDQDDEQTVFDACEDIGFDILKRIRYYSVEMEHSAYVFESFNFRSVKFEPAFLEFDNRIGYDFTFTVREQTSLAFDITDAAGKWSDLP